MGLITCTLQHPITLTCWQYSFHPHCVCACLPLTPTLFSACLPLFFLILFPSVVRRTNILRAELPWRCTQPSQKPNRGIILIGSEVLHHKLTNAHILALACRPAWTNSHKQTHMRTHTYTHTQYPQMHVYAHTMTDCSSLIWCFSQWFIAIPRPGNCLQNARSEKTHSDDLGQIEALPSATDNSSSERRRNFKEGGRGERPKTRCTTDDKTRELISTKQSARQTNTLLRVCPRDEYSQSKPFTFSTPSNV